MGGAKGADSSVADPTFADIERLIRTHGITSLDDLLPRLPEEYRRHYLFVYDSRSTQADNVSPSWPRVILFGRTGKLLLAFTRSPAVSPGEKGDDTLESIEFEEAHDSFVFRRLTFSPGTDPLAKPVERNPSECLACHGSDPRPNWDSYNMWLGVYGSLSRFNCARIASGTREIGFYMNFVRTNRARDRYRFLPPEKDVPDSCPGDPSEAVTAMSAAQADAPADLSLELQALNLRRLVRTVRASPRYEPFRFLWAAIGRSCFEPNHYSEVEEYFPKGYAAAQGAAPV